MAADQGMSEVPTRARRFGTWAFHQYRRELLRYLHHRLRNPHDVDDVAQEVYLRLLRHDEERCVRNPLAYLYGVAAHAVADHLIATQPDVLVIDSNEVDRYSEEVENALPDDLADRVNLQQQLERAIRRLPPRIAAALLAYKRDGMSYEEVAQKLGLTVWTVEKYVVMAKAQIRTMSWHR